jgi:hypothetical protein
MVSEARAAGEATKPMLAGGESKIDKLMKTARRPAALSLSGAVHRPRVPETSLQRKARETRARPAREHQQLVGAELSLSLAACAEATAAATRQAARAPKAVAGKRGIVEAVKRAGLRA